jgi:hypothetical protein
MKHLLLTLTLLTVSLSAQTGAVLKLRSNNTLTEALATGSKTLTISATGTLTWTSGATLSGASDFRTAAGLGTAAVLDTGTDSGDIPLLGAGGNLTVTGVLRSESPFDSAQSGDLGVDALSFYDVADSGFWQLLTLTTPTANRTHTLPDRSGTLLHADGNGSALTALNASNISSGSLALARIAQGGATSGQVMAWNGTAWAPAASGGGLTIGTTTITSGTSGRVLYNNGGVVGEVAESSVTADALTFWSTVKLEDVGGGAQIRIGSTLNEGLRSYFGQLWFIVNGGAPIVCYGDNLNLGLSELRWGDNPTGGFGDNAITRMAAGHLMQRYGTNAQRWGTANTYTSGTNYEVGVLDWQTTSNTLRIGSDIGSGGGTARDVQLIRGGTVKATLGANTTDHAQPVKAAAYTVATLPAAATVGAYSIAAVSDATSPTVGSTVTGGGSAKALVCSNGTAWLVIAVL